MLSSLLSSLFRESCSTGKSLHCSRRTSQSGPSTSLNVTTCPSPSRPWRWREQTTNQRRGTKKETECSWLVPSSQTLLPPPQHEYVIPRLCSVWCLTLPVLGAQYMSNSSTCCGPCGILLVILSLSFFFYFLVCNLQLMLQSWNSLIFENVRDKLLLAAMKFLYNERSGEAFDSQLVIGVRESFGEGVL